MVDVDTIWGEVDATLAPHGDYLNLQYMSAIAEADGSLVAYRRDDRGETVLKGGFDLARIREELAGAMRDGTPVERFAAYIRLRDRLDKLA